MSYRFLLWWTDWWLTDWLIGWLIREAFTEHLLAARNATRDPAPHPEIHFSPISRGIPPWISLENKKPYFPCKFITAFVLLHLPKTPRHSQCPKCTLSRISSVKSPFFPQGLRKICSLLWVHLLLRAPGRESYLISHIMFWNMSEKIRPNPRAMDRDTRIF